MTLLGRDRTGAIIAELRIDGSALAFPSMRAFRDLVLELDAAKHAPR